MGVASSCVSLFCFIMIIFCDHLLMEKLIVLPKTTVAVHCCKEKNVEMECCIMHYSCIAFLLASLCLEQNGQTFCMCTQHCAHDLFWGTHTFHIPFWGIGTINCMTIKCSLNTRIQIRVRFQQHVSEFECHFPGPMLLLPCWIVSGQSDTRIYVQECDEMLLTHLIQPQLVFIVECNL
jgi:hypothetical protein